MTGQERPERTINMLIYNNIRELVGSTPLLQLHRFGEIHQFQGNVFAKLEFFNPTGSVKDRAALSMLDCAVKEGKITKESIIIEATSGNTGIGLASMAVSQGYRVILTMPDTMSVERRNLLSAYGAELVLTEGKLGMQGAVDKAKELEATLDNAIILGQFENQANVNAHYNSTGPEIWADLNGNVDVLVAGIGTGGTISGTGKFLKEKNPKMEIIAVEPADSPLLSQGKTGGHKLQGMGPNFIPSILDTHIYDQIFTVTTEDAFETGAAFAKIEGALVGISSGAALSVAKKLAVLPEYKEKNIVVILPDSGDRYLSSPMFST